jgi:hypothetical protein
MKTRSQTRQQSYIVEIDFDGASEAWKANKVSTGNGTYTYRCSAVLRNGEKCSQKSCGNNDYCKRHLQK